MAGFKARIFVVMSFVFFLGACVQTMTSSYVLVNDDYLSDRTRENLVEQVYAKAKLFEGECKLISSKRQYHTCSLKPANPSFQLNIGYNRNGDYLISVISTFGQWLPPSEANVVSGEYLSDTQKDLEIWMLSLIPKEAVIQAQRSYIGYDAIQEF